MVGVDLASYREASGLVGVLAGVMAAAVAGATVAVGAVETGATVEGR